MIPTGPVTAKEVRDLLKIGLKSEDELHPDFQQGKEIAKTEPSPVSTSLAVANQGEASEGPERAGNKPLMENPSADAATPTGILPATPICDINHVFADITQRFFKTK